eukprot:281817-Chlamydomonas_euryale.AAC.7
MLDTNEQRVKIVDFGSAVLSSARGSQLQGSGRAAAAAASVMLCTPAYRPPESLAQGYELSKEVRSDVVC